MKETDDERLHGHLRRHVTMLREHFDSVTIIACRTLQDGSSETTRFQWGDGSWIERFGALRMLLLRWEESERKDVRESDDE